MNNGPISSKSFTPCECRPAHFPFVCPRHGCEKTVHLHQVCQTRPDYFQLWERGLGPGQTAPQTAGETASPPVATQNAPPAANPGMAQRAWNLAGSVAAFVFDGCQTVTTKQYAQRLQICDGCDSRRRNVCVACGCYISVKAHGRAMACPRGKWPVPWDEPIDGSATTGDGVREGQIPPTEPNTSESAVAGITPVPHSLGNGAA